MDDAAVLARLDRDPDAIAVLYRRHVARLQAYLELHTGDPRLAADLCAESFAAALIEARDFDSRDGDAGAWLDAIARRLAARAERRGRADARARKRLGLAPLEPGAGFVRDLEEELVAAARFRAGRRARPRLRLGALPRPPARAAIAAAAGIAVLALAALVLGRSASDPAPPPREEPAGAAAVAPPDEPPEQPAGTSARVVPMLAPAVCRDLVPAARPAVPAMPGFAVFDDRQRLDDRLPGTIAARLPVATFDPGETRLAANGRRGTRLHVVPSLAVSDDGSCATDDGPGLCLVAANGDGGSSCFTLAQVRSGQAFAATRRGSVAGIVTDGTGRVTLSAGRRRASARVADNVYEAELGVPPGTVVGIGAAPPDGSECERHVSPGLLARVGALRRAPTERLVPMAVLSLLREDERIAEVAERDARYWGAEGGVEFWVIPVARAGAGECAPADAVCVAAVTVGRRADAECGLNVPRRRPNWRFAPLLPEHAAIYGTAPDGVAGVRVTYGTMTAEVPVRDNVIAAVLPFPYASSAEVELVRRPAPALPRVAVVGAGGDARAMLERLRAAGYHPLGAVVPGIKRQPQSAVHWRPRGATLAEAAEVARVAGAARLVRIASAERTPLPVQKAAAPVVVVVGAGAAG